MAMGELQVSKQARWKMEDEISISWSKLGLSLYLGQLKRWMDERTTQQSQKGKGREGKGVNSVYRDRGGLDRYSYSYGQKVEFLLGSPRCL